MDNARSLINGRRDTPLTELGRAQALAVAEQLRSEVISCVYTSPLQRASQTASIISERLGIDERHVEPDLIERDYGVLTGKSPADITVYAGNIVELGDFRYVIESPGVEDYTHLWTRAGDALQRIQNRHFGQSVLVVAHNEVIKMMRANFHGNSWEDELKDEKDTWLSRRIFPLYLLVFALFAVPLGLAGHLLLGDTVPSDAYVLFLPWLHQQAWLTLFAFSPARSNGSCIRNLRM